MQKVRVFISGAALKEQIQRLGKEGFENIKVYQDEELMRYIPDNGRFLIDEYILS